MAVDIKLLGVRELERKLRSLEPRVQRTVVRKALRESAKRTKQRIVDNLTSGAPQVQTGTLRQAWAKTPIRGRTRGGLIRVGPVLPGREELNIPEDSRHYYPTAVEYGHGNVRPYPYIRPAVDEHLPQEHAKLAREIGQGIEDIA